MRGWFKVTFVCALLLTMLCGGVIAIAHAAAQSRAELMPEFRLCDEVPCYLGIVPDKTLFHEVGPIMARARIDAVEIYTGSFDLPRFKTHVLVVNTIDVIDEIDISLKPGNVLLAGDIIREFGRPCLAASLGTTLAVKYPYMAVFFAMDRAHDAWVLNPTSRVIEIRLLGGAAKDCRASDDNTVFRWRGFTSYF